MKNYKVDQIKTMLDGVKTALIAVPQLSIDSLSSALALALLLKKSNIDVSVYSPQKTDNNYSKLSGLNLLTNTFNQNDLVVTLNYPVDQIEHVSYNDDGGRLNLVVKTKNSAPKIENQQIEVQNQSSAADINFMLGDEAQLGPAISMVNKGNWILISPVNTTKPWAKETVIDPDAPFSEIFSFLIPMLGLNLDPESAKNLLIGLRVATQSFSVNVSPETFEAGAICLKATQTNGQPIAQQPTPIEAVESTPSRNPQTNNPTQNSN